MYIKPNDNIRFSNVVSRQYTYHYKDMEEVAKDFFKIINDNKLDVKGPFFYSINNLPMDEGIVGELFMPVHNDLIEGLSNLNFYSYFSIEDMVSTCVYENPEVNTEIGYFNLLTYIDKNNLKQITPIFHVILGDRTMQYVFIKIGITDAKE